MRLMQRLNTVEVKSQTQRVKELRAEYHGLDIFDQAKKYDHYKALCESEGIDEFLLVCSESHFKYLLKHDLVERF